MGFFKDRIKAVKRSKFFAHSLAWLLKQLEKTLTVEIDYSSGYDPKQPYLFAFWHGQQLLPLFLCQKHQTPSAAMVSPSNDGEILAAILGSKNFLVIRGSSRDNGVGALKGMLRAGRDGYSIGFGIDGPIGPIYQIKPGIIHLAQRLQMPILPLVSKFEKKWILHKAWDKFEIPKPFSKAKITVGEPFFVDPQTSIEDGVAILSSKMSELSKQF